MPQCMSYNPFCYKAANDEMIYDTTSTLTAQPLSFNLLRFVHSSDHPSSCLNSAGTTVSAKELLLFSTLHGPSWGRVLFVSCGSCQLLRKRDVNLLTSVRSYLNMSSHIPSCKLPKNPKILYIPYPFQVVSKKVGASKHLFHLLSSSPRIIS